MRFAVFAPFGLVVALAIVTVPGVAEASGCCGDPGGLGQRLAEEERWGFTFAVEHRERFGAHGGDGTYRALDDEDYDRDFVLRATTAVRPVAGAEIGVSVPVVATFRELGGIRDAGGGVGDITTALRLTARSPDAAELWPGLFFTTSVVLPTGLSADEAEGLLLADATGQGSVEVRGSVEIEEVFFGHAYVLGAASLGWIAPQDIDGVTVARSPRAIFSLSAGPLFDRGSVALGVEHEREDAPFVATRPDESDDIAGRHRTWLHLAGILRVEGPLSLVASVRTSLPVDGAGQNEPASVASTLGLRLAFADASLRRMP